MKKPKLGYVAILRKGGVHIKSKSGERQKQRNKLKKQMLDYKRGHSMVPDRSERDTIERDISAAEYTGSLQAIPSQIKAQVFVAE